MFNATDEFMRKEVVPNTFKYEKKDYKLVEANVRKAGE